MKLNITVLFLALFLGQALARFKVGRRCDDDPDWCIKHGLSCVGPHGRMRCFPLKTLGQKCRDPYWVCEDGLVCKHKRCKSPLIGKKGSCNDPDDVCEDGLNCVGPDGNKKCFPPKGLGESCRDPFWICEEGLVCEHKRCKKPKIGKKGSCNDPDDVCEDGLNCVGPDGNKKCFPPKGLGESCRDPFWICEEGLVCEHKRCIKPKIGKKGSCNDPDDVCEDGLNCVGPDGNKKCFPPKGLGESCRDPFWICEEGLVCEHKRCKKPKIGKKGSCNEPDDVCEDGLSCVGNEGNMRCFAKRKEGENCGKDPFWVCEDHLICKHKVCVKH